MSEPLFINPNLTIPDDELAWSAVRASGPGGQNVNKVSSKVLLRFDLAGTKSLDQVTKARLARQAASRLDADGALVVASQLTRDQRKNLEDAREKLRELVLAALVRPKKRRATKPSRASNQRRLETKQRHGAQKRQRRLRDEP